MVDWGAAGRTLTGAGGTSASHVMGVRGRLRLITRDYVLTQFSGKTKHVRCSMIMGTKLLWVRGVQEEPSTVSTPGTYQATTCMR